MKLLINCSFNYYRNNSLTTMTQYALIVDCDPIDNIEDKVIEKLNELNFKLPDRKRPYKDFFHAINLEFTAQNISI